MSIWSRPPLFRNRTQTRESGLAYYAQKAHTFKPAQDFVDTCSWVDPYTHIECLRNVTEKVQKYSTQRYGRVLCYSCQQKQILK